MFTFQWQSYQVPCNGLWQSIDVVFRIENKERTLSANVSRFNLLFPREENAVSCGSDDFGSPAGFHCLLECLQAARRSISGTRVVKFIIPLTKGQIVRSDIVSIRFRDCELIESALSLSEPLQEYSGQALPNDELYDLRKIFLASAAAFILDDSTTFLRDTDGRGLSPLVEVELENRLSFPWIIEPPITNMTLAIVEGGGYPSNGQASQNIYLSAKALGISLVVLDNSGHWLEGPEFQDWRQAFLPITLIQPPDAGLTARIVASIKSYERSIDGIITFRDSYQAHVADAARQLGLVTSGPEAYEIATDKHKLSIFEGREAYRISDGADALDIATKINSLCPAMIKPCAGWSSDGCFRIDSVSDLLGALKRLDSFDTSHHGADFVIEPFCCGPEVIVNFAMLDGKILFTEFMDTFPKTAELDAPQTGRTKTFVEQDMVTPSKLPAAELNLLRVCLHNSLLRLGIRHGILHLEARVKHSTMEYRVQNGVMDLRIRDAPSSVHPYPWLIEINPRPPGSTTSQITESTYGIDYWGLALLLALGDGQRAEALSKPYSNGPQYTAAMVVIQVDYDQLSCEGVFDSDDICVDLLSRRPDLAKHISQYGCFLKRGDKVQHPSSGCNRWLAYFNVFSRRGSSETLQIASEVRREVRFRFR